MTRRPTSETNEEFFEARVFRPDTPCWNWRAYVGSNGYGKWVRSDRQASAHRIAYEMFVGPIAKGMQIHHKCFNRSCVNPAHLEAVTGKQNKAMSLGVGAVNKARTHCTKGHPFDAANTHISPKGYRVCRSCRDAAAKEATRKNRGYYERDRSRCKNGHEWTEENTARDKRNRRVCRACKRATNTRLRRSRGIPEKGMPRTHCKHGHAYTPENTYTYERDGATVYYCRTCNRASSLRAHHRRHARA